jgi:hypothetical protein
VLVQNETVFKARASSSPGRSGDLVQLYSAPPASYDQAAGAPYGAGHCNFSVDERLGVIALLDDWARRGVYPAAGRVRESMSGDTGVQVGYVPGAWPAELDG